ncbi:MAG: chorismate synthase [Ruminococcaceae bacterium]|nr:chorismate synthase [Oscillospiraceae bacterium]
MSNIFGNILKLSIFGESHSEAIGVVLDGLPSGLRLDFDEIQKEMARRAPGRDRFSTPRKEADIPRIVSGFFEGRTTGTPLCALIENTNTRSKDYSRGPLRPSHADFTAEMRYHGFQDYRGGGHFSGRITAPLVFAGAVLKPYLQAQGIEIFAHIKSIGTKSEAAFNSAHPDLAAYRKLKEQPLAVLEESSLQTFSDEMDAARKAQDSIGGVIECMVYGVPAGLGSPFFDSVESRLSAMLFSVPAVKGVEFGAGFSIATMRGSEANDPFYFEGDAIHTKTNNTGGINGGITNGMPVCFSVAIRPTPSIAQAQSTVNLITGKEETLAIHGRHDPCIVPRAVSVIEAVAAFVTADLMLEAKTYAE